MKIGIVTFWTTEDNYGQIAQLFALQEYLRKIGHQPFLIRYIDEQDKPIMYKEKTLLDKFIGVLQKPSKVYHYVRFIRNKNLSKVYNKLYNRKFDEFKNKYIEYSELVYNSFEDLKNKPPKADMYICGSDIIWNEFGTKSAYFLKFADSRIKKIAFAPSFAKSSVSNEFLVKLKSLLSDFEFIGVREKSGIEICQKAGFENAQWVPDPTMLLDKNEYCAKLNLNFIDEKYVFVYFLGYEMEFDFHDIELFAKQRNLKIKYVSSQNKVDKYEKIFPTMEEWFENIKNADYVFTNSFHCCVISLIFNRNFLFIPLLGHTSENNERIHSLFHDFKLDREYQGDICKIEKEINWEYVNKHFKMKQYMVNQLFDDILYS